MIWGGRPKPPEGVRLILPDGSEVPVELIYEGRVDGFHTWRVSVPLHLENIDGVRLTADAIPPRTAIVVGVIE